MRTPKILPGILAVVPATILLTTQASWSETAAQTCRASPGAATPAGSHWYFRINHADKRHCWYLGAVDARTNAGGAALAPPTPDAASQPPDAAASEDATASPAGPPEPAPAQIAPEQVTPAAVAAFLKWSLQNNGAGLDFSARWPDGLPAAQDLNRPDAAPIDTGYAENHAAADPAAQLPQRWPVVDAMKAPEPAAASSALRIFSFAGAAAILLLLLAGWAARLIRAGYRSRDRKKPPAGYAETDAGEPAAHRRRGDTTRRPPTLTDPALDLRTSLAELMGDLERAAAASNSVRSFAPHASRARNAPRRTLQAAE